MAGPRNTVPISYTGVSGKIQNTILSFFCSLHNNTMSMSMSMLLSLCRYRKSIDVTVYFFSKYFNPISFGSVDPDPEVIR